MATANWDCVMKPPDDDDEKEELVDDPDPDVDRDDAEWERQFRESGEGR